MDSFATLVGDISNFMYGKLLIVMLLSTGIYFSIRTGLIQIRLIKETIRVIMEKPADKDSVSSFQALMVSTASRVGTGNIVGVASAICLGGFGAIFWMWITAFFGGASAFIESTLAQIYKKRGKNGSYGGPAYYIEQALHCKPLSMLFSVALIATYGVGFNLLCSYNLQSTFSPYSFYNPDVTPSVIGAILAVLVGWCLFGGGKRVVKTASVLVPFMGLLYVIVSAIVVVLHADMLPQVFAQIFNEAFDFEAIFGGFTGSCVMLGIKRGLYSNEAGVGSAPNAAAAADVTHPVKQGLVQMFSVFIDTMLLCTATAFVCMTSGVATNPDIAGAPYVQAALAETLGEAAVYYLTVAMILFAFTTLLGNLFYVDNCLAYILGHEPSKTFMTVYRILACIVIFVGAGAKMGLLWDIADVTMGFMALINIPTIIILGGTAIKALDDYIAQRDREVTPVFHKKNIAFKGEVDYWD